MKHLRTYLDKIFRRFSELFWSIFDFFSGGHIRKLILFPEKKLKIDLKKPENRLKLFIEIGSRMLFLFFLCSALFSCTQNDPGEELDYEDVSEEENEEECGNESGFIPDPQEIALDFDSPQW